MCYWKKEKYSYIKFKREKKVLKENKTLVCDVNVYSFLILRFYNTK